MTQSNFNDLIGFDKVILTENVNVGPRVPNLNQHLDVFNIHCDLIHESLVDGEDSDIIYSFSTSVLHPSFSFTFEPKRITFNPIDKTTISSINMYITDGKRRRVYFNRADVAFSLLLRKIT